MPNVRQALRGWGHPIMLARVQKGVSDFSVVESVAPYQTYAAVIQPTPPQAIAIKPEGQRQWKWWTIWTKDLLELDWVLRDGEGKVYRVMERSDWSQGGFYSYQLAEAPI